MTEAQKPVQPVTAWAVVDKDGVFTRQDLIDAGGPPHHSLEWYNSTYPSRAPHRVIKVEIGPKGFAARITALEAREAALVKADDARTEIVKAAHLMFVYCQKMSAKIKAHRLEQIMPSPDAEIQAFIKAVNVSREARSLISAQEGK